jgi:DNA polymerase III sliding clamp (beta) subunit (PCNA family)
VLSLDVAEFPPVPEIPANARTMTFPAAQFMSALKSVADAISTDESRYVLNGVCVDSREDGLRIVATNGRILFLAKLDQCAADAATLAKIQAAEAERIAAHAALDAAYHELAESEKVSPPQYSLVGKIPGYPGREFYEKIASEDVKLAQSRVNARKHAAKKADECLAASKVATQILIPAKAVKTILAMPIPASGELSLTLAAWTIPSGSTFAAVTAGDYSLATKQIEGNFPNYPQVIPQDVLCSVSLPCVELAAAVKQAATVCTEKSESVKFHLSKNLLRVTAKSDLGETNVSVSVNYHDKEMCIAINPEYILDAIAAASIGGAVVQIDLIDELSPAVFRNTAGWKAVVMPMRLS